MIADRSGEWCGLPMPLNDARLVVEPSHPASKLYATLGKQEPQDPATLVNVWYSHARRCDIYVWREPDGRLDWGAVPAIHHADKEFSTMACSVAWSLESENKALELLRSLIPAHLWKMYYLTGMFPETSGRSGVSYLFRRLRPTVALRPASDGMKILAALCLHPIGYYADTWAGSMCPTDDVIAHLLLMRADEPFFWKRANQIAPHRSEAGL